jgi:hypothetical protein
MTPPAEDDFAEERIVRLPPEYRRCGLYIVAGTLVAAGLAIGLQRAGLVPPRGVADACVLAALLAAEIVFCTVLFRWRLRVDGQGIYAWYSHVCQRCFMGGLSVRNCQFHDWATSNKNIIVVAWHG